MLVVWLKAIVLVAVGDIFDVTVVFVVVDDVVVNNAVIFADEVSVVVVNVVVVSVMRVVVVELIRLILTFRCSSTNKGTWELVLLAEQLIEVILSNWLSLNWKLTSSILVHKLFESHLFWTIELMPLESGSNEFVSYNVRLTLGFESTDEQIIGYVAFVEKSFVRLIVWFAYTSLLAKIIDSIGFTVKVNV